MIATDLPRLFVGRARVTEEEETKKKPFRMQDGGGDVGDGDDTCVVRLTSSLRIHITHHQR